MNSDVTLPRENNGVDGQVLQKIKDLSYRILHVTTRTNISTPLEDF